ncbi:MAG: flippase-like domain-containing protein [Actinobacteria bacterium]|nr:flippase-like domain-containing protein [Actinomycetota bacterium]
MVVTRRDELTRVTTLLRQANWTWVAVAAGAEAISLLAVATIQQTLLRAGGLAIRLRALLGIALASTAISNSVPGGVAWANIYGFRQLRRRGADPVLAIWAKAGAGLLSAAALVLLTAVGCSLLAGGPFSTT